MLKWHPKQCPDLVFISVINSFWIELFEIYMNNMSKYVSFLQLIFVSEVLWKGKDSMTSSIAKILMPTFIDLEICQSLLH